MYVFAFVLFVLFMNVHCNERVRRIVGGQPANIPPPDDPVVYTRFNGKTAVVRGVLDFPHYVFRGIRYAQAPVGNLRFVRPQEYILEGFVNATKYPPPCVQPLPNTANIVGEEDCLFLNIFSPTLPTGMEGLPVVIWIHGGGFRYGSASQYGVRHLVARNLLVVTIQYRLGSLGFLSGGNKDLPGNAALWDMALAVQWVRNYIGFFGGNPFKIVIMGQGSGASSALTVALTEIAKGNSAGVVAMSGTAVSHWALDNTPINTARELAERNGCPMTSFLTMIKCLQVLNPKEIISGDSFIQFERLQQRGFQSGMAGGLGAAPVNEGRSDGRSLPSLVQKKPMEDLQSNNIPKIPLLLGITKHETTRSCTNVFKNDIFKSLTTIPDFLETHLIASLQKLIELPKIPLFPATNNTFGLDGLLQTLNPGKFRKYVQVAPNDFRSAFSKIAEVTTDALFNVPAFLTANMWSKTGETYLYKFEHAGKLKKGNFFLNGFPLVGLYGQENKTDADANTVSHGDELNYLFDAQHLDGTPADHNEISEEDEKVRAHFAQMIADFARQGKVKIGDKPVSPFTADANNYIEITSNPKENKNFQFCQMGLWLGLAQRLQSSVCGVFNVLDSELKNVQKSFFDTIDKTSGQFKELTGGLTGALTNPLNNNVLNPFGFGSKNSGKTSEKKNSLDGLGGGSVMNTPLVGGLLDPVKPKPQHNSNPLNLFGSRQKSRKTDENLNTSLEKMSKPLNIFKGPGLLLK
ncbi:hypothetical protein HHI36_002553 [Cryptolaemus montrouzieri]|uniref:Carboxylesterase type B domain-containing protein n=1 Tax=Cryptolaemus montrouzieri TaxID=559131 RepID=A0ABD2PAZ5_9CUCU